MLAIGLLRQSVTVPKACVPLEQALLERSALPLKNGANFDWLGENRHDLENEVGKLRLAFVRTMHMSGCDAGRSVASIKRT